MERKILNNKPLVEAIFELRWELIETVPQIKIDPHIKILIGRIYDRLKDRYPYHEQLPSANIPDQIAGYVVQHRFRTGNDKWPLVQLGPGVISLNDTEGYVWEDFETRVIELLNVLFDSYPNPENLRVSSLLLRYIDAVNIDYQTSNIFEFLKDKMKINVSTSEKLFKSTGVSPLPENLDLKLSFPSTLPEGAVHLRFACGQKNGIDALIWETMVRSVGNAVIPQTKDLITKWANEAHDLTDDWFFKIIDGDLLRRFE